MTSHTRTKLEATLTDFKTGIIDRDKAVTLIDAMFKAEPVNYHKVQREAIVRGSERHLPYESPAADSPRPDPSPANRGQVM